MNANRTLVLAILLTLATLLPSAAAAAISLRDQTCSLRWVRRSTTPATRCLGCHDGSAAPSIHAGAGLASGSHSVGTPYEAARGRVSLLAPREALPTELVLVNGELACTTCHDGASAVPHRVALPADRLCSACHGQ